MNQYSDRVLFGQHGHSTNDVCMAASCTVLHQQSRVREQHGCVLNTGQCAFRCVGRAWLSGGGMFIIVRWLHLQFSVSHMHAL
jgi:hypothetical protein